MKVLLVCVLFSIISLSTQQGFSGGYGGDHGHHGHYDHHEHHDHSKYEFAYGVKDAHTGDHKSQYEHGDGHSVKGGYTLDEADGTKRVVEYHADKHGGFNAIVKRIGHAHHPEHYHVESHHGGHGSHGHGHDHGHGHGHATSYANFNQHFHHH